MSSDEVREVIAGLRAGDEIAVTYRGVKDGSAGGWFVADDGVTRCLTGATAVRVIKRAPLPEPPVGTPVWWNGKWWARTERGETYYQLDGWTRKYPRWEAMSGAVPAATPGGDE